MSASILMPRDPVQYEPDIPRWFTYLLHLWSKRRCRRIGHQDSYGRSDMCRHCGEILR